MNRAAPTNVGRREIANENKNESNGMAKTLYHSELVKMGPVRVKVCSDVLDSKFKGKPPFVELEIDGEKRNYTTENDECADFFTDQKGRTFTIVAEGREDEATITYVGEAPETDDPPEQPARKGASRGQPERRGGGNRPPATPPRGKRASNAPDDRGGNRPQPERETPPSGQPARTAPPANKPPQETPEQKLVRVRVHANRVANVWLVALSAGLYARREAKAQFDYDVPPEQFQALVSTICVQLEKDGNHNLMPTGVVDLRPKEKANGAKEAK